jgi:hypothetical protein
MSSAKVFAVWSLLAITVRVFGSLADAHLASQVVERGVILKQGPARTACTRALNPRFRSGKLLAARQAVRIIDGSTALQLNARMKSGTISNRQMEKVVPARS